MSVLQKKNSNSNFFILKLVAKKCVSFVSRRSVLFCQGETLTLSMYKQNKSLTRLVFCEMRDKLSEEEEVMKAGQN